MNLSTEMIIDTTNGDGIEFCENVMMKIDNPMIRMEIIIIESPDIAQST